jgi:hypothetical protein|tara:strand:+ start:2023 stop:2163 length:141 start_codon:yes stop_codon:yes gene_type:complete
VIADATDPDAIQTILADLKQGVPTDAVRRKNRRQGRKTISLLLPDG